MYYQSLLKYANIKSLCLGYSGSLFWRHKNYKLKCMNHNLYRLHNDMAAHFLDIPAIMNIQTLTSILLQITKFSNSLLEQVVKSILKYANQFYRKYIVHIKHNKKISCQQFAFQNPKKKLFVWDLSTFSETFVEAI